VEVFVGWIGWIEVLFDMGEELVGGECVIHCFLG
jgi:hypothetical protein